MVWGGLYQPGRGGSRLKPLKFVLIRLTEHAIAQHRRVMPLSEGSAFGERGLYRFVGIAREASSRFPACLSAMPHSLYH